MGPFFPFWDRIRVPSTYHPRTIYVPFMYHLCTIHVPFMYHPRTIHVPISRTIVPISRKSTFSPNGHVPKSPKCEFFKNKSPCGVLPNIGELFRIYLQWMNSFSYNLKKWLFPKHTFLIALFHMKVKFDRKPWSVWSIWTYSTQWLFKCVIQKISCWGSWKLRVSNN